MSRQMRAMELSAISIDAEMVGKIYLLACNTMSAPTDACCDSMAVNLLDSALDAALAVHDGSTGVTDLSKEHSISFKVVDEQDAPPVATGMTPFFLSPETEKVVLSCCKAAGVNPHEFVEGWIGGLVESSLSGDIATEGITADLLAKYGHKGEAAPDAYVSLLGRLKRIISRARGRKAGGVA